MSVHARKRARGRTAYEVIWRDEAGRQRCETFSSRREAETREREIRDLRERGRHERIDAGSESLREATERWWPTTTTSASARAPRRSTRLASTAT